MFTDANNKQEIHLSVFPLQSREQLVAALSLFYSTFIQIIIKLPPFIKARVLIQFELYEYHEIFYCVILFVI